MAPARGDLAAVSERRILLWVRLLVGAGFMYHGVGHVREMRAAADLLAASGGWQAWPLVGGLRPLEVVLWLALLEFFLGVFLFGGLLTRVLGAIAFLVSAFQVAALGAAGGLLNPLLLLGSAAVAARGGGAGTMDATLGKMQRRSLEREAARRASRR
jgi:uncharacterized membrane protein YphA (DoxX/SURF4 family)